MCELELAFIEQTKRQLAPGVIDALVDVTIDDDGVRIEEYAGGWTRLYYAARRGWCSAITWLLEQGADVLVDYPSGGWTPLHAAAAYGHCDAAVLLLDAGARVDDRDHCGHTALHFAAGHGQIVLCKLLLSRGASLDARTNDGDDPEASARSYDFDFTTATADFLAAVRAAGGWRSYVDAPRKELLALRRELPTLFRTGPCRARASPALPRRPRPGRRLRVRARVLAQPARPLGATKPGVTARCSARGGGGSCRRGRARAPRRGGT